MNTVRNILRNSFIALSVMLLVGVVPAPVFAEAVASDTAASAAAAAPSPDTANSSTGPANTTGTNGPTGAASWTYWFNQSTGLWENDYYTYNPSTKETVPKQELVYTYNPTTGLWDTKIWQFSAAKGAYSQSTVSVTVPPFGAKTVGGPPPLAENKTTQPESVEASRPAATTESTNNHNPSGNHSTGSAVKPHNAQANPSQNAAQSNQSTSGVLKLSNSGSIMNFVDSAAQSGDAVVIANTTAGDVSSGDSTSVTNILNLLQSQSAIGGENMPTFTANIQGNVQGDFLIDPASLTQPANVGVQGTTNLKVNSQNEGTINNTINLTATSGNTTAGQNTTVGNVTSGDANAIANVINMINSAVAANQSFMGVINIHGDYTGNILMPTDSLNALLGSTNTTPTTAVAADVNTASTQNINNDIDLSAASGSATSSQNTTSGSVASGSGLTNLTLLNLTGRRVIAANSLLVFVNVLGNWVGLIMDAPAGTTSAALGGGVTHDTAAPLAEKSDITTSDKLKINNVIKANANSGDAAATQNTTVGDVRSGNATASANVANIIGSQFSLANWFGILFINVFGTWRGNFGVAKPPVVAPVTSGNSSAASPAAGIRNAKVFTFAPKTANAAAGSSTGGLGLSPFSQAAASDVMTSEVMVEKVRNVLAASENHKSALQPKDVAASQADSSSWSPLAVALGLAGFGYVGIDRVRTNLRNRRSIVRN